MSRPPEPLFVERRTYRRRRMADAAIFLPVVGLILLYASLMKLLGRTAQGAVASAQSLQARNAERRERRA